MLSPVGNPINLAISQRLPELPPGYQVVYLDSATSALALAIELCKLKRQIKNPEIIIPAYGCPDLIAACVYAEVKAVLVDLEVNSPNYDHAKISDAITSNTIAIIAVNFLGIKEKLESLKTICKAHDIHLIEDNAQWFPDKDIMDSAFIADLVCLSFGKGKPISLLGGGMLLIREKRFEKSEMETIAQQITAHYNKKIMLLRMKYLSYNCILRPFFYAIFYGLFKHYIGKTIYHELNTIFSMDKSSMLFLYSNMYSFNNHNHSVEMSYWQLFSGHSAVINLPEAESFTMGGLLRYPILFYEQKLRNKVVIQLQKAGLGVSTLYESPLSQVAGLPNESFRVHSQQQATQFANGLMTLPVHCHVKKKHVLKITKIINELI